MLVRHAFLCVPLDAISRVSHLDIVVVEPRTGVVSACSYFHGGTAGAQVNAKLYTYICEFTKQHKPRRRKETKKNSGAVRGSANSRTATISGGEMRVTQPNSTMPISFDCQQKIVRDHTRQGGNKTLEQHQKETAHLPVLCRVRAPHYTTRRNEQERQGQAAQSGIFPGGAVVLLYCTGTA